MSAVVFAGPTIAPEAVRRRLDTICLPPVRQGDVHRAVLRLRPRVIGIVDGYFQHAPSVWHKEILWAMAEGVHLFGSASMGALRAAELDAFGMRGVGRIFEAYRSGRLAPFPEPFEDDDEVAVIHGPAETGYLPLSEAMVNIRCTLAAAETASVIDAEVRTALTGIAKRQFYHDRSFERLLGAGRQAGLPEPALAALEAWLPAGRVDQKRRDAEAMLSAMAALLAGPPAPMRPSFRFAPTTLWERVAAAVQEAERAAPEGGDAGAVLDELRLEGPAAYRVARRAALSRLLGLEACAAAQIEPDLAERRAELRRLREVRGLYGRNTLDAWLQDNDLVAASFERLINDEAALEVLERQRAPLLGRHLLDQLRLAGDYPRLARRARAKRAALGAPPAAAPSGPGRLRALAWYFGERLGTDLPDDLASHARELGHDDLDDFCRMVFEEYRFARRASS